MTTRWCGEGAELASALHDSHPDGCLVFQAVRDAHGRLVDFHFVHLNPAAEALVRELSAHAPLLGRGGGGLIDFEACARVVETGEAHRRELLQPRGGSSRVLRASVVRHGDGFTLWLSDAGGERLAAPPPPAGREGTAAAGPPSPRQAPPPPPPGGSVEAALVDEAPLGLALLDATLTVRRLNPEMARLEGLPLVPSTHLPPEGVLPAFVAELSAHCQQVLASGQPVVASLSPEAWTALQPGHVWQVVCFPVARAGQPLGVGVSALDITERVRGQEALRTREERQRLALEAAGMVVWEWTRESRSVRWSEGAERFFGLAPHTLGTSLEGFLGLVHPEDRKAVGEHLKAALEGCGGYTFTYRHLRPDGEVHFHEVHGRTLLGPGGRVGRMLGVVTEVTEREQAACALRLAEERSRLVGQVTRDIIWDWNLATGDISWNEAAEWMLGYRPLPERMDFHWWEEHLHPKDRERVLTSLTRCLEGEGDSWQEEYRFLRADGIYLHLLDRGAVVRDGRGRAVRMVGSKMDVSSLKRAEEERAREAEFRERFVGILGHDLRTPLNAISLSAQAMSRRGELSAPQRDMVGRIQTSASRMERMISEILDLTRARLAGGIPVYRRECNMHLICRQVVLELRAAWPERDIRLEAEGLGRGEFDSERMEQALGNLVANACQHCPPGQPVTVRSYDAGEQHVVEVHNAGPPIPADVLPTLFQAFRQGRHAKGRGGSAGLGLGLFIVREIARAHGGTVDVRSSLHGGTTFSLSVPKRVPAPGGEPEAGGERPGTTGAPAP